VDTAGLRDSADAVEKLGIERSLGLLEDADLIILVLDGTENPEQFLNNSESYDAIFSEYGNGSSISAPVIPVWNKSDLSPPPENGGDFCPVSAKTGAGLDAVYQKIAAVLEKSTGGAYGGGAALGSARQKALIDEAIDGVENALALHDEGAAADLIAPSLRSAVDSLGGITGEVSNADILEAMFSRFCVGK
jgi:tRNA modification GTPase